MALRHAIKTIGCVFLVLMVLIIILEYRSLSNVEEGNEIFDYGYHETMRPPVYVPIKNPDVKYPVILWWTPLPLTGEQGQSRQCGSHTCIFTINRAYRHHPKTKAFIFYGTDFHYGDLPVPRQPQHEWALFHEESPKNNYLLSHGELLELFNHSATFRRESDLPLTLQYLHNLAELETRDYLVSTSEKNRLLREGKVGLINYVQSDCGVPSDRDHFVKMISEQVHVDSYGECEHNKDLPNHLREPLDGMFHEDFYKVIAQYKFTITFENAVCNDYVTEKFWRPFKVGSVPIVFGSPKIKDLLPSPYSAVLVSDFTNIQELVKHLKYLDEHDEEYEKYLSYKQHGVKNDYLRHLLQQREWGTHNDYTRPNMIDTFECMVCERLHENMQRAELDKEPILHQVSVQHYGCPKPRRFKDVPHGNLELDDSDWWATEWIFSSYMAKALRFYLDSGGNFTTQQVQRKAHEIHSLKL